MGSFGCGNFENDSALDWVSTFCEKKSTAALSRIIRSALKLDEGFEEALAAAEVVAAINGYPSRDFPDEILPWASSPKRELPNELVKSATAFVEKAMTSGELKELWEESDSFRDWIEAERELITRLQQPRKHSSEKLRMPTRPRMSARLGITSRAGGGLRTRFIDFRNSGLPAKLLRCHSVDIDFGLDFTFDELREIGEWLAQYPEVYVNLTDVSRVRGFRLKPELLEPFSEARKLICCLYSIKTIDSLSSFSRLTHLYLGCSEKITDWSKLSQFASLVSFGIGRNRKLEDLDFLISLSCLRKLDISGLDSMRSYRALEELPHLETLQCLVRPIEELPNFETLTELKFVEVPYPTRPFLEALGKAPGLEEIHSWTGDQTMVEDFQCLKGHPTLKRIGVSGFGWQKRLQQILDLTGLSEGDLSTWPSY